MRDYLLSLIRTGMVSAIGMVLGWLTAHGVGVPAEHATAFVAGAVGIVTVIYYAAVRAVEARAVVKGAPWVLRMAGVLLGGKAPTYAAPDVPPVGPGYRGP